MAIKFLSTPNIAVLVMPNIVPKIARYIAVWVDHVYGAAVSDSDNLYNLVGYDHSTQLAVANSSQQDVWFEGNANNYNLRTTATDADFTRWRCGSWQTGQSNRSQVLFSQDMSDISITGLCWQDGIKDTNVVREDVTYPVGTPPGWNANFTTLPSFQKVLCLGGWFGGGNNGQAYDLQYNSMACFTSNQPFTENFYLSLYNRRINPLDHPGCFFFSTFDNIYPVNEVTGDKGFYLDVSNSLPVLADSGIPFPKSRKNAPIHIRQEIPETPITDLFPNTVFYDTFTDTNGTLIDSHTPDTHTFSYGWEKLGISGTGPNITDNRLNFTGNGANQAARIRTGITLKDNALRITGKAGQINNFTNQHSIYVGTSAISSDNNATWPANRFAIHLDSGDATGGVFGTDQCVNDQGDRPMRPRFEWGTIVWWYYEILLFSDKTYEIRAWPVRTDIGGGEVAFEVDRPGKPFMRNRLLPDPFDTDNEIYITYIGWYGDGSGWELDWAKIESSAEPLSGTSPGVWNRKTALVIQSSQVNSTLTDFPVLFTEANLPSEMFDSDGTYPAQNGGGDIRFTSDVDGKYLLPCEVVDFVTDPNPANGKAQIWVKVPSISSSANTTIYVWYNTADTKTQYPDTHNYGRNAVWADYEFVTHDIVVDSTGNHTINITGTEPHNGRFGTKYGALGFGPTLGDGGTDVAVTSLTAHNNLRTYQVWAYRNGPGGGGYARIFDKNTAGSTNLETCFVDTNSANQATYYVRDWSTADENKGIQPPLPTGAWYKLDITYDSSSEANSVLMYQQGVSQSLYEVTNSSGTLQTSTDPYIIGNRGDGIRVWNGYLAEFRIRNSILSADWLDAEYTSQNAPATFVQVGENAHGGHLLPNVILDLYNLTGLLTDIDDPDITPGNDDSNWLTVVEPILLDTFTDTNSTQIQNHTPELSPSSWVKNGATSYPQIQSNKLVFNANGASETAEMDLGLNGTTAFSNPYTIRGEVTWLSPGGGVMTIEIGEKPLWTGLQINSTGFLLNLDDELSRVSISKRISEVETVVDTYSGYDWTANSGVHSFEMKVYSTGVMEARVWPSSSSRPSTATCTYDYSADSAIYTMTSRELTIATWVNTNFELNDIYVDDTTI